MVKGPAEPVLIRPHLGVRGWLRRVVTEVWFGWNRHRCTQLGAAIAFYGIFSLLPLLMLVTSIFGFILASWGGAEGLKHTIGRLIADAVSPQVAKTALDALSATESARGQLGLIGIGTILLAATGAFVQLEAAAQVVWDVRLPGQPVAFRHHVIGFLRNRFVSFLLVAGAALLVFLSLIVDVMLNTLAKETLEDLGTRWRLLELTMGFFAAGGIVTILFRWLPARPVPWRAALVGGWLTAGLWEAAKQGLTAYLTRVDYANAYPILGSALAILLWVYLAALVWLLGGEVAAAVTRILEERGQVPRAGPALLEAGSGAATGGAAGPTTGPTARATTGTASGSSPSSSASSPPPDPRG